jgi:plasmid replication initiation protein
MGGMVTDTPKSKDHLLPVKHDREDLFLCDVADAVLKDIMPQMEHPFFSLSKKPETRIRKYEHNGNWIEITPSVKGLATIYDKDILIYCISQIMAKLNRNEAVGQKLRITSRDLLVFTNRGTAGKDYNALCEALDRLEGTRIRTNIRLKDEEQTESFGLIDASSIKRKHGLDGRLLWVEIKLSDWVFNAIRSNDVLTLHPDYFRLSKPLERRLYELARKHCGRKSTWMITLDTLHKKSGSTGPLKRFREMVKDLAVHDHLPDYKVAFDEARDMVGFFNRDGEWTTRPLPVADETLPSLPTEAYEEAREAAPGYDIHGLEAEWRDWWESSGRPTLGNPAAAFVGFCRSRHKRAPIKRQDAEFDGDTSPALRRKARSH